eukprot:6204346-Pleurochrysis_carterae.AAC.1
MPVHRDSRVLWVTKEASDKSNATAHHKSGENTTRNMYESNHSCEGAAAIRRWEDSVSVVECRTGLERTQANSSQVGHL